MASRKKREPVEEKNSQTGNEISAFDQQKEEKKTAKKASSKKTAAKKTTQKTSAKKSTRKTTKEG